MYKYYAYGLRILSDTCFEQFVEQDFEGKADLMIHHYVEEKVKEILKNDNQVSIRGRDIFFRNHVGFFEARGGNEIFYEEHEGKSEVEAREFVMGNTFALLFFERDINVIHGAAVRYKNKTIIISGNSGAGKSTITTGLINKEAKLITDDQSVIYIDHGIPMIVPGYPSQKLCEDAVIENDYELDTLVKVDNTKNKFAISRAELFYNEISKVDAAFFMSKNEDGQDLVTTKITGAEKANIITDNLFLKPFLTKTMSLPPKMMIDCFNIAGKIDVYSIARNVSVNTKEKIIDFIDSSLA